VVDDLDLRFVQCGDFDEDVLCLEGDFAVVTVDDRR
jgi:hypothetical protein